MKLCIFIVRWRTYFINDGGSVMIYLFNQVTSFSSEAYIKYLSKARRKQYDAYKFQINKDMCLIAFLLLRLGLLKEYGIKLGEDIEIEYGIYGKPYLKKYKDIFFNLSHRKECVACVISDREVGIDVETLLKEEHLKIANDVLNVNEMMEFKKSNNKREVLTRFWTLKECYVKQNGKGLSQELQMIDFANSHKENFQLYDKYFITKQYRLFYIAACSEIPIKEDEINIITNLDLF